MKRTLICICLGLLCAAYMQAQLTATHYLDQARIWQQRQLECLDGREADSLGQYELVAYLNALRSEADCHYMLDNYQQLGQLATCYHQLADRYQPDDADEWEEQLQVLRMYGSKLWGSYWYGQTDLDANAFGKAEQAYLQSLGNPATAHYPAHQDILHQELAQLYYKWGLAEKRFERYEQAYSQLCAAHTSPALQAQQAMCLARMGQTTPDDARATAYLEQATSLIDSSLHALPRHTETYFGTLRQRGKILMIKGDRLHMDNRSAAAADYLQYVNHVKADIGNALRGMPAATREQHWLALHQFATDCNRLGPSSPDMLYDLALFTKGFLLQLSQGGAPSQFRWQEVRRSLKQAECAIEFVQYRGRDEEGRLAAMLLKPNSTRPTFIDLVATDSLLATVLADGSTLQASMLSDYGFSKDAIYTDTALFSRIWTPRLMQAIGQASKVYFAPEGVLHNLAIEYMMPDSTKECRRLSSTRVLLDRRQQAAGHQLLLCGGPAYYCQTAPTQTDNDRDAYHFLARQKVRITDLPSSLREVDSIYAIRAHAHDTLLTAEQATDEAFTRLSTQGYPAIHLSTHGYYAGMLNSGTDLKPALSSHIMSESGLLFAGAAHTLGNQAFNANLSDGILSAEELSRLQLGHVGLMVLSACQTGLGEITADGVYGIQRALKQAGVRTLIVSLWSVDDYATYLLMHYFYEQLGQQKRPDVHQAFMHARKRLLTEQRVVNRFRAPSMQRHNISRQYNAPQYTNPYIIIDAI